MLPKYTIIYMLKKYLKILFSIVYVFIVAVIFVNLLIFFYSYYYKHQLYGDLYITQNMDLSGNIILFNTKLGRVTSWDRWVVSYPYLIGTLSIDTDDLRRIRNSPLDIKIHGNNTKKNYYIYNCKNNSVEIYEKYKDFLSSYMNKGIKIRKKYDEISSIFPQGEWEWINDPRDFRPTCQYVPENDTENNPLKIIY